MTRRKLVFSGLALGLGAGGYYLLRGFEDSAADLEQIPPELRGAALDVHVHAIGAGTGGSGCWMHQAMRSSLTVRGGLWNLRLRLKQPDLDQAYIRYLISRIRSAGFLKQVVLLAQDWTHTERGERDEARTPFHTPNAYVAQLARIHAEILFGA